MTTTATQTTNAPKRIPVSNEQYQLSFLHLLRSEWTKLVTLRSTWWSVGIVAFLTIALSTLMALSLQNYEGDLSPVVAVTASLQFSMLMAGVMGAISITGEYSTGMVRSTFTAAPKRAAVVFAKAIVLSAFMILVGIVIFGVSTLIVSPLLDPGIDFGSFEYTWLPLIWAVLSLTFFAIIGLSFGFIIRNGAGAIALTVALIFVLPMILGGIFTYNTDPAWDWVRDLMEYLPMRIAAILTTPEEIGDVNLQAALSMIAWIVVGITASVWAVRNRDV